MLATKKYRHRRLHHHHRRVQMHALVTGEAILHNNVIIFDVLSLETPNFGSSAHGKFECVLSTLQLE